MNDMLRRLPERVTRLSARARYAIAIAAGGGGLLLRLAMDPVFGRSLPFIMAFPAIMVSAWLGGFWPGMLTTLISAAGADYFWFRPGGSLSVPDAADAVALVAFLGVGAAISGLNEAWRRGVLAAQKMESERRDLVERERHARAAAERASGMKDQFLSMVSHELRTPLHAVLGYADLLTLRPLSEEERVHAVTAIQRNARTQAELIDSLLDLSRIETGKLDLQLGEIDLSAVVSRAAEVARPAADAKKIALEVKLPAGAVRIIGDGTRLQQVVWNLLSNAVKFTHPGGRVELLLDRGDSRTQIRVSDTGQGIRADFLPHVFDRFAQGPGASTRPDRGLGLGLAIVRELVEAHGGTVTGESAGEGRGSTFTVTLPVRAISADV
jgi:signal transduction histidine kinase